MKRLVISLVITCLIAITLPQAYAQSPAAPVLGSSTFFADVKSRLTSNKTKVFHGSYLPSSTGFSIFGGMDYAVFRAEDVKMETYLIPTSGVGKTITDVVSDPANANALVITNGAQFGYGHVNRPASWVYSSSPDQEPQVTIGNVVSGGSVVSTNASAGARAQALKRYFLAQEYSIADAGSAASYFFSQPPIGTKGNPPLDDAALGGLVSLVMPTHTAQTLALDADLSIYEPVRLFTKNYRLNPSIGYGVGFNIIGVNRANGMIIVLTKQDGVAYSIFDAQALLLASGTDLALVTDGGQSTACWIKGASNAGYVSKGNRHNPAYADKYNTVTNYLVFAPR